MSSKHRSGFTIVELLIVIVVIAILAALSIVAYTGIQQRATDAAIASKESQVKKKLEAYKVEHEAYPATQSAFDILIGQQHTDKYYTTYTSSSPYSSYTISTAIESNLAITNGSYMQVITNSNCPDIRTRAVDARDNKTYWVQKLSDGKCWMLTNLAYTGGGSNAYSDTKSMTDGTGGSLTYTEANYYSTPPASNYTTEPNNPSVSTDGTGQYGYLYNWCAAMGSQVGTAACSSSLTPQPDTSVSACASGWRLPTANGGEFAALNTAINGGSASVDTGLRSMWLGQYSGRWYAGFNSQGSASYYWSSTPSTASNTYRFYFSAATINTTNTLSKNHGFAVRCVAN